MSSDDPEIIPPNKNAVVTRNEHGTGPVRYENAPSGHLGVIGSTLTGWRAEVEARAYGAIAERIRAQRRVLDAETERRKSALALLRVTGMLEEAPDILALDRAHRIAERAEKYAAIESKYGKIVDDRDELGHKRNITKLRREREIQEANARLVDAKRDRFTAEQKLENEQRLRQFDLESLQKRTETQHLEKVPALEPRHDAPTDAVGTHSSIGSLAELRGMRESLLKQARERAAEGDGDQAKEYEKLIAELDEFVIAVSRGQGQK